jgi:hypothetical protein
MLTTANAAGTNSLTCLPKHGRARDNKFWSPIQWLTSMFRRWAHWPLDHRARDMSYMILWWYRTGRSSTATQSMRFGVRSRKLSNVGQLLEGWSKIYYLELLRASEGTLSHWSRLHLQSLAPTNPHWARVVYGPFSLCVIYKEGLCPSSRDINRLMIMMISYIFTSAGKFFLFQSFIFLPILLCISIDKQKLGVTFIILRNILSGSEFYWSWRPIWRSGWNTRLLRKRSRVRFPHSANICVHEHVYLYWV